MTFDDLAAAAGAVHLRPLGGFHEAGQTTILLGPKEPGFWSYVSARPEFKLVTGVSTGALTAPFAFLGPDYDDELKEVYTTITSADIFEERSVFAALFDDAMADNHPG